MKSASSATFAVALYAVFTIAPNFGQYYEFGN